MSNEPLSLWISRLSKEKLPAFAHTARSLASVSRDDDSSANDLSNVILHDSAMTARVLRLANSVSYNPSGNPIETVSYATVLLGFEQVRNLALTVAMIDTVLAAGPQRMVQEEMVCAYHAAIQAQRLAKTSDPENIEAIYIGALLHRLGPIMFWCFPFGHADALNCAYKKHATKSEAEVATLGFKLDHLTKRLVQEWHLSDILGSSLGNSKPSKDEETAVQLGFGIANSLPAGWTSQEMLRKVELSAKYLSVAVKEARQHIYDSAKVASDGLDSFGFPQTLSILPPDKKPEKKEGLQSQDKETSTAQSDLSLELRFLRQFTQMLSEKMDLNRMLMAILEGIHRAREMNHVFFALVDYRAKALNVKYMIGPNRDEILAGRKKSDDQTNGALLAELVKNPIPTWYKKEDLSRIPVKGIDPLILQLAADEFFINPIMLQGKVIGVVYADRPNKALDDTTFQSFSHFSGHATLAFNILSSSH